MQIGEPLLFSIHYYWLLRIMSTWYEIHFRQFVSTLSRDYSNGKIIVHTYKGLFKIGIQLVCDCIGLFNATSDLAISATLSFIGLFWVKIGGESIFLWIPIQSDRLRIWKIILYEECKDLSIAIWTSVILWTSMTGLRKWKKSRNKSDNHFDL